MIKNLKQKIIFSVFVLGFAIALYLFKIPCPVLYITKIHCLGCGMTRALLSALRFDFAAAFSYHFMFFSVPFLFLAFLFDGKLFKSKIANIIFYSLIGLGFIINWIFKLIT